MKVLVINAGSSSLKFQFIKNGHHIHLNFAFLLYNYINRTFKKLKKTGEKKSSFSKK